MKLTELMHLQQILGKNGKVQEYDLNDNLVFEGEYKDGQRYNGTYIKAKYIYNLMIELSLSFIPKQPDIMTNMFTQIIERASITICPVLNSVGLQMS